MLVCYFFHIIQSLHFTFHFHLICACLFYCWITDYCVILKTSYIQIDLGIQLTRIVLLDCVVHQHLVRFPRIYTLWSLCAQMRYPRRVELEWHWLERVFKPWCLWHCTQNPLQDWDNHGLMSSCFQYNSTTAVSNSTISIIHVIISMYVQSLCLHERRTVKGCDVNTGCLLQIYTC